MNESQVSQPFEIFRGTNSDGSEIVRTEVSGHIVSVIQHGDQLMISVFRQTPEGTTGEEVDTVFVKGGLGDMEEALDLVAGRVRGGHVEDCLGGLQPEIDWRSILVQETK